MAAEEKIHDKPFVKNQYYPGKLLHASDFVKEQEYGSRKLEFVNHKFHGWGIIDGLDIWNNRDNQLELGAGSALDPKGRMIIVPSNVVLGVNDISGLTELREKDFILGIHYEEQPAEKERCFLDENERYHTARILETFCLKAYSMEEWRHRKQAVPDGADRLTRRSVLYENEAVRLSLEVPGLVPSDSIFRIRIQAQAVSGGRVSVGWKGAARLQGGRFLATGHSFQYLTGNEILLDGNMQQEWQICTDEGRRLPVVLEIDGFEVRLDGAPQKQSHTFQFYIETAEEYRTAMRELLWKGQTGETPIDRTAAAPDDWIPLARIQMIGLPNEGYSFCVMEERRVRSFAVRPWEEEVIRNTMEQNGIVDVRWRQLLKTLSASHPPGPRVRPSESGFPGQIPYASKPRTSKMPEAEDSELTWGERTRPEHGRTESIRHGITGLDASVAETDTGEPLESETRIARNDFLSRQRGWLDKFLENDRKKRISRGIAVITVPKRYKRGQVLFSDEISHGFPGEEVLLWCGRVHEERNYAYWDRNKTKYTITHGAEDLFPAAGGSGWVIEDQALCQDVDAGTFQIALTLLRGSRKNKDREVAVSWVAVRTT